MTYAAALAAQLNFKQVRTKFEQRKKSRFASFLSIFFLSVVAVLCLVCVSMCTTQRVTYLIEAYQTEVHAIFEQIKKLKQCHCIEVEQYNRARAKAKTRNI